MSRFAIVLINHVFLCSSDKMNVIDVYEINFKRTAEMKSNEE